MKSRFWKYLINDKETVKEFNERLQERLESLDRKLTKFAAGFYSCLFLIVLFIVSTVLLFSIFIAIFNIA